MNKEKEGLNKRQKKMRDKQAQATEVVPDRTRTDDGFERVDRRVFGEQVHAWIPVGTRAQFILEQRLLIAQARGRNVDSSDSEDSLSEHSVVDQN